MIKIHRIHVDEKSFSFYISIFSLFFFYLLPFELESQNLNKQKKWKIDYENSYIRFSVPHLFSSIEGEFEEFKPIKSNYRGTYRSLIQNGIRIKVKNVKIHQNVKNEILSRSFFYADKFPEIKVLITNLVPFSKNSEFFFISFKIHIKDINKEYIHIIEFKNKGTIHQLKGSLIIPRRDFQLEGNLLLNYLILDPYVNVTYQIILKYE